MINQKSHSVFKNFVIGGGLFFVLFLMVATPVQASVNLDVPFSIQIPNGKWVQPFKDACEETALLIVNAFYRHTVFADKQDARKKIEAIVNLEDRVLGFNKDTNAEVMTRIINDFLSFEAHVVENPTIEMIKEELDAGRLVVVPANGRLLPNPYYKSPGPLYHVVVIVGYDDEHKEFITNDPATRHGKNFRYAMDVLMNANADWNPDINGERAKVMVFTSGTLTDTFESDADNDGLSKQDEIAHGTNLYVADSDNDGYKDGQEVAMGFDPLMAENKLQKPFLARVEGTFKVFWIKNLTRYHVLSAKIMNDCGWHWGDIRTISTVFFDRFQEGEALNSNKKCKI